MQEGPNKKELGHVPLLNCTVLETHDDKDMNKVYY